MSRLRLWTVPLALTLTLALALVGCDYSTDVPPTGAGGGSYTPGLVPVPAEPDQANTASATAGGHEQEEKKTAILKNVLNLIQTAALKPGGDNFRVATLNLNQYFAHPSLVDYALDPEVRAYLAEQLPEPMIRALEKPDWAMPDARHLEDCMIYDRIASRVAGTGDDLVRVRRVFDWMVSQVQLVPPYSLATRQLTQVQARPYDVLMRGMATENQLWAERAWLFMALCRQLGIDVGLLTYHTRETLVLDARTFPVRQVPLLELVHSVNPPALRRYADEQRAQASHEIVWLCAALIDGRAYLFDTRIGLPVPGPDGAGVATLDQALRDPNVLAQMELPGESTYGTSRAALLASPTKIRVLLDSSPGYFAPRMRRLQHELQGEDQSVLYRDPAQQAAAFRQALGPHAGAVKLWSLPVTVFTLLFHSGEFVQAAQQALALFDPRYPLVYPRVKQLRGDLTEAIEEYVAFRFAEHGVQAGGKVPLHPEEQRALDIHATYFLGLCHLEQNNPKQAEFFFKEVLRLTPEPGPGRYPYYMFRWGAATNLARLAEARGDRQAAERYYTEPVETWQHHGNLLRARALIWTDPMAPVPDPLPPAPPRPEE